MRIGLVSDTHGLMRPQAIEALQGSHAILHAGDIGDPAILEALARIAPLHAVRGNNDTTAWASVLPETPCCASATSPSTCCTTCSTWRSIRCTGVST